MFPIFANKRFTTTVNAVVNNSNWQLFSKQKNFHISKMRTKSLVTFSDFFDGSNHPYLKIRLPNKIFILND